MRTVPRWRAVAGCREPAAAVRRITTPVCMAVVYFLIFTPAGPLMRLHGQNPLMRGRE